LLNRASGDSYDSEGIQSVADLFNVLYPSTFVYPIRLASSGSSDRSATFLGNVNTQLAAVCEDLAAIPELAHGFNALGFSQGGQFLRGYVERCNSPPVKTLVTFGSQHNGIAEFIARCEPGDWVCSGARGLLRNSKWSALVQGKVVPAQYFRDPEAMQEYLENSNWLADVNNEREMKNVTYKENLKSLERFVMFMFRDDETVVPKESAWWAEVNRTSGEITPLQKRPLYTEDWLGLRKLDMERRLEFLEIPGEHMRFEDGLLKKVFEVYFGPHGKKGEWKWDGPEEEDTTLRMQPQVEEL
jgi:palmitoyl-protein thioesterase